MPELVEQMYCSQQIVIPPKFPYILKRFCKAAIKTQPYDLLRWSFEYFKALSERRPPPVKLRLEYPVYSTEGGLTRGCLKVLARQLAGAHVLPLQTLRSAWQGFCLDPEELRRILCLCEVFMRSESVNFLHFIAVAGGLLTKNLTHTMILLCEILTKEPDGGSAAIPVHHFLTMYRFLAQTDASKDVKYLNGYREGFEPQPAEEALPEEQPNKTETVVEDQSWDDYWSDSGDLQKVALINDHVARSTRLSMKFTQPILGKIERSPSAERAGEIERQNYLMDREDKPHADDEMNKKSGTVSEATSGSDTTIVRDEKKDEDVPEVKEKPIRSIEIHVLDEGGKEVPIEFYGEPSNEADPEASAEKKAEAAANIVTYVNSCYQDREERIEDLLITFDHLAAIVDRYHSAFYDLGMVAGRQMSTTSGEFIVQQIEKDIMEYINEQIGILPDPDLKKKKAKPEEVAMVRQLLERFIDENMHIIVPEVETVEEEEEAIPEIITVYAVPGIGGLVDDDTIRDFEEYAQEVCKVQADLFMPRNIRHFMCPPLEKYDEHNFEEVATSGVITD